MASVMSQLGGAFQVLLVVVISISSFFFFYLSLSPIAASRNRRNIIKPIQYYNQSSSSSSNYHLHYHNGTLLTVRITINSVINNKKLAYIWIGNSEAQCPGYCAWPIYGPQNKSLTIISPNNDMGLDGMVANFAGLLASTVTNPFGDGYYYHHHHGGGGDGDADAPLEAASACRGMYAGDLLVDPITGASYNANGAHGRRYLVPAIYDPITSTCSTLI